MMPVFQAQKTINGWNIGLTPKATELIGVGHCYYTLDQYARYRSLGISRSPGHVLSPPDLLGMLARFLREATNWTREEIRLPRRSARYSSGKRIMCETIAQVANERLGGIGSFQSGVDTHGLNVVFAPLLVSPEGGTVQEK